jgi:hypothetical protein
MARWQRIAPGSAPGRKDEFLKQHLPGGRWLMNEEYGSVSEDFAAAEGTLNGVHHVVDFCPQKVAMLVNFTEECIFDELVKERLHVVWNEHIRSKPYDPIELFSVF